MAMKSSYTTRWDTIMAQFACKRFPPPENVSITVMEADRRQLETLKFIFSIDYADDFKI